jgi:membrane dipeptidase
MEGAITMAADATVLHRESIIIDCLFTRFDAPIPPTPDVPDMMLDHVLKSGVTAVHHSVIADPFPMSAQEALMRLYEETHKFKAVADKVLLIRTADDIRSAKAQRKLGVIFGAQGLASIGNNVRFVWIFHGLGVRIMQLVYDENNALGSGGREPTDLGLTRLGQAAIEEMNRLGVVLDLSHVGLRTSMDALEYSKAPAIFSHSSVKALCNHPRNLTDEQIEAIAQKGGVIGICPRSMFVEKVRRQRPTIDDFIDHIDYIVQLVGIDHVGIGTENFQYDTFFIRISGGSAGGYGIEEKHPIGFSSWLHWPGLTRRLIERGYTGEDIKKILGGNFLRLFELVWQ